MMSFQKKKKLKIKNCMKFNIGYYLKLTKLD